MELRGFFPGFSTFPVEILFFFLLEVERKRIGAVFLTCEVGAGETGTCVMKR